MQNNKKRNRIDVIKKACIAVGIIMCLIVLIINGKNKRKNNNYLNVDIANNIKKIDDIKNEIILNITNNKEDIFNMIKDRYIEISADNKKISIGKNKKELDNGYYDFTFELSKSDKLVSKVVVNKLWKEFDSRISETLCDEYYLKEISRLICFILKINYTEQDILDLETYIQECYMYSKNILKDLPNNVQSSGYIFESKVKEQQLNLSVMIK